MSNPVIKAFFKQVQTDKALQAQLRSVNAKNKEEAAHALALIALEAGYRFTARQYLESIGAAAGPPPARVIKPEQT